MEKSLVQKTTLNVGQSVHVIQQVQENNISAEVCILRGETEKLVLRKDWGKLYTEGAMTPRKFAINVLDQLLDCPGISALTSAHVLFEPKQKRSSCFLATCTCTQCSSGLCCSVHLVLSEEPSSLASPELPIETCESIKAKFIKGFQNCPGTCDNVCRARGISDVISAAVHCIQEALAIRVPVNISSLRDASYSLDVFEKLFGWQCKSFSMRDACAEINKEIHVQKKHDVVSTKECSTSAVESEKPTLCEICFEESVMADKESNGFAAMSECMHWFCNGCWELHLKTQIFNGQTELQCPGHQCKTSIDDVTVMSLVPSWYGKYLTRKINRKFEGSREWKRCPSEQCKSVSKVTTSRDPILGNSKLKDDTPIPVLCVCGGIWCFSCEQLAHWPASCSEAHKFRAKNKGYAKVLINSRVPEIRFVEVKKCPTCRYPIEKYHGCMNMFCIICGESFCWSCLQTEKMHNYSQCRTSPIGLTKVEIPKIIPTKRNLVDIAFRSCCARKAGAMFKVQKRLADIGKGLSSYVILHSEGRLANKEWSKPSRVVSVLENMVQYRVPQFLQEVYNFKFQAHVVLEGTAIKCLTGEEGAKKLRNDFYRFLFILEKLEDILGDNTAMHKPVILEKLSNLVENGEKCIFNISRHATARGNR